MNFLKKDQSRSEIILVIGLIVLTIVVIARFFGSEISGFFFGAGSNIEIAGTDRDKELLGKGSGSGHKQNQPTPNMTGDTLDISRLDPSLYGDEDAIARLQYEQTEEKREQVKKMILWTFALMIFVVVVSLIIWKTYTIIKEIRLKNM